MRQGAKQRASSSANRAADAGIRFANEREAFANLRAKALVGVALMAAGAAGFVAASFLVAGSKRISEGIPVSILRALSEMALGHPRQQPRGNLLGARVFRLSRYVQRFGSFDRLYGSLGAVVGFMTWIWLSTLVVLMGAQLKSEMEHQTAADTTTGVPLPLGLRRATQADTAA